jgi:alpha-mannosidase
LDLFQKSFAACHPIPVLSDQPHTGVLPVTDSLLSVEGCVLSGLKMSEDQSGLILRIYRAGSEEKAVVKLPQAVERACLCDLHEKILTPLEITNGVLCVSLAKQEFATIWIPLSKREER